jgi:hypothetical protein
MRNMDCWRTVALYLALATPALAQPTWTQNWDMPKPVQREAVTEAELIAKELGLRGGQGVLCTRPEQVITVFDAMSGAENDEQAEAYLLQAVANINAVDVKGGCGNPRIAYQRMATYRTKYYGDIRLDVVQVLVHMLWDQKKNEWVRLSLPQTRFTGFTEDIIEGMDAPVGDTDNQEER